VRAMWASLRSPIGSGMGLHTRPLPRLVASWWWMRSHAASSPLPQAPFRRHCHICCTTLLACLPLFCWLYFLVADSVFPAARAWLLRARLFPTLVYGIRTALGSSPPRRTPPSCTCAVYVHLRAFILGGARPRNPTPPSTLLHLRAPSTSTCASASLPAGVRATQHRLPPHLIPRCNALLRRQESCIPAPR
jgi:hypothetical protein